MAGRVLFTWELGDNLGHIAPFAPVARGLAEAGWELHVALKQLNEAHRFLGDAVTGWHQAPVWGFDPNDRVPTATYADLLRPFGYVRPDGLTTLVRAWRSILDAVDPQVLLVDSSPTALLAARGRDLRRILFSNGYSQPPVRVPLPAMRWWDPPPTTELRRREQAVVDVVRQAQEALGEPPIEALAELFDGVEAFLVQGTPVVDAYGTQRRDGEVTYLGDTPPPAAGDLPDWPAGSGPKVFAYLSARYRGLPEILAALDQGPGRVLAYVPRIRAELAARTRRVRFVPGPLRVAEVRRSADAVVCHSASGTGYAFLMAGVPALLLPMHLEQEMAGRLPAGSAAAILMRPERSPAYARALQTVCAGPSRKAARAFAKEHRWRGPDATQAVLEALARGPDKPSS